MISGIIYKNVSRAVSESQLITMRERRRNHLEPAEVSCYRNSGFIWQNDYPEECQFFRDRLKQVSIAFQGRIYNLDELKKSIDKGKQCNLTQLIVFLYLKYGEQFIERFRGKFVFALYDHKRHIVILGRDRIGIEPLYHIEDSEKIVFGTSLISLVDYPEVEKALNFQAVYQFLLFCYNPAFYTIFRSVQKLRPGHLFLYRNGSSICKRYWKLSFANIRDQDEDQICEELRDKIEEAVRIRCDSNIHTGVFLSGGMDSSTVVSFAQKYSAVPLRTFSYRCRGVSFDESMYAQIVSDYYKTIHSLVGYGPEEVERIAELVKVMDEPFCDLGINIATELLGENAQKKISCVLTGDGGDELFGGHPVYLADRVGQWIEYVPRFLRDPFLWMGSRLKDSDKKKDFRVKWKRFSQSIRFPASLLSHRWRIYYSPDELVHILNDEVSSNLIHEDGYQPIMAIHEESDGSDLLSKSLYSDYCTVVGFYLRRMDLIRRYGIESRFPLLDHRLVEFGATIHPRLKIGRRSETKYILKQAMKDILPKEIVFRRDKLGHSIPMKNWMRDDKRVQTFMMDILSEASLKKRRLFNEKRVSQMISEHLTKRSNHSHRLWALMVLELWLRKHIDS